MQSTAESFEDLRKDFPVLNRRVRDDKKLVYFDNAATTQKPNQVIDAITDYYQNHNSNIHRAVHALAEESTEAFENTRDIVAKFLNIEDSREIIFVRGTTEGINLVAYAWGRDNVNEGDIIVTTEYEHHSNIVPWQLLTQEKKAQLKYIDIDNNGELMLDQLDDYLSTGKVKLVTFSHMSNVLGTISPINKIVSKCKNAGVKVLIDGAQAVPHMKINLNQIDCDFYVFSGHKMLGPTGVGVLWGKSSILNDMPPFIGGGDMIDNVEIESSTYAEPPHRFEAGTPPIAEVIAFGSAIDFVQEIGMCNIRNHENILLNYFSEKLMEIKELSIIGNSKLKSGVISFVFENAHPHDIATILDQKGIAIRAGHHCAQPLMKHFNITATARASIAVYTKKTEVDDLIKGLMTVKKLLG